MTPMTRKQVYEAGVAYVRELFPDLTAKQVEAWSVPRDVQTAFGGFVAGANDRRFRRTRWPAPGMRGGQGAKAKGYMAGWNWAGEQMPKRVSSEVGR